MNIKLLFQRHPDPNNRLSPMPLLVVLAIVLLFLTALPVLAAILDFEQPVSSIAGGGNTSSTGGMFSSGSTIGQAAVGSSTGGSFSFQSGFWSAIGPSGSVTPAPTTTHGTPNPTITGTPNPTITGTPIPTSTGTPTTCDTDNNYIYTLSSATIIPGTARLFNSCPGDCDEVKPITLPFPVTFYGESYKAANVSSNGNLQFVTSSTAFNRECSLPGANLGPALMPYWTDIIMPNSGDDVYTSTSGTSPNQIFSIEWRGHPQCCNNKVLRFSIQLYEDGPGIDFIYADVQQGTYPPAIGVQTTTGQYVLLPCDIIGDLTAGKRLRWTPEIFSDVGPTSTFYEYVRDLYCQGAISGYVDGTFRPGNNTTRGQIAKIVSNAAGFSEPHSEQTFEDIPTNHSFYVFIERLASRSIISGYACGGPGEPCGPGNRFYFRPGNNTSRGQLAKIACLAFECQGTPSGQSFEDVSTNHTFYLQIEQLYALGAVGGYVCGGPGEPCGPGNRPYYRPGNNVTRGQLCKIIVGADGRH